MSKAQVEYEQPDAGALMITALGTLEVSQSIKITSPAMYDVAAEQLREVKDAIKTHTEKRLSITRKIDDVKAGVMSLFNPSLTKLWDAKDYLEMIMLAYNAEQKRLQAAEQARLETIARQERERLEDAARKIQEEADLSAKQAKGKAAKAEAEQARLEAQERADALRMTAAVVVAAPSAIVVPKADGTSQRGTWKAKCDDKMALIKFIAGHPEYQDLVDVSESALNALARSQQDNMAVGGCTAYERFGITTRR